MYLQIPFEPSPTFSGRNVTAKHDLVKNTTDDMEEWDLLSEVRLYPSSKKIHSLTSHEALFYLLDLFLGSTNQPNQQLQLH